MMTRSPWHPWIVGTGFRDEKLGYKLACKTMYHNERYCPVCGLVHLIAIVRVPEIPGRKVAKSYWISADGTVQRGGMAPPCFLDSSMRSPSADDCAGEERLLAFLRGLTVQKRSKREFATSDD